MNSIGRSNTSRLFVKAIALAVAMVTGATASLGAGHLPDTLRELKQARPEVKATVFQSAEVPDKPQEPAPDASRPETRPLDARNMLDHARLPGSWSTVLLLGGISLLPAAILMVSAFVRIQIVLALVRQALGNPQIPGNQVLTAVALLLTLLVMRPVGVRAYERGLEPFAAGRIDAETAWNEVSGPIKQFMIEQIVRTGHERYVWEIHDLARPASDSDSVPPTDPPDLESFPFHVLAAAFLISELTTALFIGFAVYLPFLVIDLVVSAVLSAMGLFLLPPALVSLPLKLALFEIADGWMLTAGMLLRSFGSA